MVKDIFQIGPPKQQMGEMFLIWFRNERKAFQIALCVNFFGGKMNPLFFVVTTSQYGLRR